MSWLAEQVFAATLRFWPFDTRVGHSGCTSWKRLDLAVSRSSKSGFTCLTKTLPKGLIVPNTTNLFAIISILHSAISIPVIILLTEGYKGNYRPDAYSWLLPILWPLSKLLSRLSDNC